VLAYTTAEKNQNISGLTPGSMKMVMALGFTTMMSVKKNVET
jgi:hypothetical protein